MWRVAVSERAARTSQNLHLQPTEFCGLCTTLSLKIEHSSKSHDPVSVDDNGHSLACIRNLVGVDVYMWTKVYSTPSLGLAPTQLLILVQRHDPSARTKTGVMVE